MIKNQRQKKILEIIREDNIETQEDLISALKDAKIIVTQATTSRDIKELRLVKVLTPSGRYRYVHESTGKKDEKGSNFISLFTESVIGIDFAINVVVVKCYNGTANAACAAFDTMGVAEVVGTISGDDTFICIMRTEKKAKKLFDELNLLMDSR